MIFSMLSTSLLLRVPIREKISLPGHDLNHDFLVNSLDDSGMHENPVNSGIERVKSLSSRQI